MGGYGTLPLATTITLLLATVGTPGTRPPYPLPLGQGADLGSVFRDLAVEEGLSIPHIPVGQDSFMAGWFIHPEQQE